MKRAVLLLLLLTMAAFVIAAPVSSNTASLVARNFILERLGSSYSVATSTELESRFNDSYIYIVNLKPQGFVLVAADDAAIPILGYSAESNWGDSDIPPQLQYMIDIWNNQMHAIVSEHMQATPTINGAWRVYNKNILSFVPNTSFRNVSPLISSIWGQGTYYNAQCPSGTPVGCVATAMSQIMKYWSFPTVGSGSHSYSCPPYGTLSADFGATTYAWSTMPNNVTSSNAAVATICYQAGVAVDMDYAPDGSGAYSTDVPNALMNYFRYASGVQYKDKSTYSDSNWLSLIKGQLDIAYPVYYSGSGPAGGHAWILDGYQNDNFHVNWGWNGSYNGYYTLTSLNPGGDSFNVGQAAVINIHPGSSSPALTEGFESTTFPPTGWSRSATTWTRATTSFITGTASALYQGTANNVRLVTPKVTIGTSSTFSFKAKRASTNRSEIINVQTSPNGTTWTTYYTTTALTSTATTYSCTFSTLTPGDYYIAINANSSNSNTQSKTIYVDDVSGPNLITTPSLSLTSWAAGNLAPGDQARSGDIFTLSNLGGGTLTVSSVSGLSGTEFTTNFNSSVALVYGQSTTFGFAYDPINYGTDNANFQY